MEKVQYDETFSCLRLYGFSPKKFDSIVKASKLIWLKIEFQ